MAGDGGRVPDVSEQRAEIEAVARAIHRVTPVALLVSHPTQMRLLEWEEESERRRNVWRRMAWAARDCVRAAAAAARDDEVIRPRLGGGWECGPFLQREIPFGRRTPLCPASGCHCGQVCGQAIIDGALPVRYWCPDCGQTGTHASTCGAFPGEPVVHGNREPPYAYLARHARLDPASVLAALLAESPEVTVSAIEALLTSDDAEKPKRMRVDDLVTYKQWTGRVYEVLSDGSVLIDWSGHCQGFRHPFHHGPYRPDELMEASHKGADESARLAAHEAFSTALSDRLVVGETLDRVADAAVAAYLVAACRSLLSKAAKENGDA